MSTDFLSVKRGTGVVVDNMRRDYKLRLLRAETETTTKHKKKDTRIKEKMKHTNISTKRGYSSTPPNSEITEKSQTASPLKTNSTSTTPTQDSGDQPSKLKSQRCVRKSRKPKDMKMLSSLGSEKSTTSSFNRVPAPSSECSAQDMESLRWEGVLEDPLEEERRLEVYRAKRRQRYLLHRQEIKAVGESVHHPESRD